MADFREHFNDDKKLTAKMKADVKALEEIHRSNEKLYSLLSRTFDIDEMTGGTKTEDGGRVLGRQEHYMDTCPMDTSIGNRDLEGKKCIARYKKHMGGGWAKETFKMLPPDAVIGLISIMFEKGWIHHLSEGGFPSMSDLFWSMGYHFMHYAEMNKAESLLDIFKFICQDKDWDSVSEKWKREAKKKNPLYRGN